MLAALLEFITSSSFIGAIAQGLCYSAVAVGVYITFRCLAFPDLTIDGSLPLGAGLSAVLILNAHWPPWLTLPVAFIAGTLAGMATALLTTQFKINGLLSGILVSISLFTVNLHVMGERSNLPLLGLPTIFSPLEGIIRGTGRDSDWQAVAVFAGITLLICLSVNFFLHSEIGLALRATGDNDQMIRAQGVNTDTMKVLGLALSNGLVALSGAMLAQYSGFADVNLGSGLIVAGLAAVIIGESLVKPSRIWLALAGLCLGSVVYRVAIAVALRMDFDLGTVHYRLNPLDLKLATAVLVVIALSSQRFNFSKLRFGK